MQGTVPVVNAMLVSKMPCSPVLNLLAIILNSFFFQFQRSLTGCELTKAQPGSLFGLDWDQERDWKKLPEPGLSRDRD